MHEKTCGQLGKSGQMGAGRASTEISVDDGDFQFRESAIRNVYKSFRFQFGNSGEHLLERLRTAAIRAVPLLREAAEEETLKTYLSITCDFYKASDPSVITDPPATFNSAPFVIFPSTDIEQVVESFLAQLLSEIEAYEKNGSGWVLFQLSHLDLNLLQHNPMRASSFIKMPRKLVAKKGYVNVRNDDQRCFVWSILAHLHPADESKSAWLVSNYKLYETELNLEGLEFPLKISDIDKFEQNNSNISVTVFGLTDAEELHPVRVAPVKKEHHVQLLYLSNKDNSHYVYVRNLSALAGKQINKHHRRKFYCENCLNPFQSERLCNEHFERCTSFNPVRAIYPTKEENTLRFTKIEH